MTNKNTKNKELKVHEKTNDSKSDIDRLLEGIRSGECKGIGGGTAYKIVQYAKKIGVYK